MVVAGDGPFRDAAQRCFDQFIEMGDPAASLLNSLRQPRPPARHRVTLQPTAGYPSAAPRDGKQNDTTPPPGETDYSPHMDGSPGAGADSTVSWNPNDANPMWDGTPRDPCISLLHELQHAADVDQGTLDTRTNSPSGIINNEIHAIDTENQGRKKKNLPRRKHDDHKSVPDSAVHP